MQLAGRVPADIAQIIISNPEIPAFLRRIKMTKKFDLDDDETRDLMDGLYAFDTGSVDSGIKDDEAKEKLKIYLRGLTDVV